MSNISTTTDPTDQPTRRSQTMSAPRKPQDHKAADAAKSEATIPDGPVEIDWRDQRFIVEPDFKDDVEILEDLEDDKVVNAVRRILGPDQWDRWKDANRGENGRVTVTDAKAFIEDLFEELGQGN